MKTPISLTICLLVVAVVAKSQSPQPSWRTYVVTKDRGDGRPERQRHVFDSSADGVDYKVFVVENPE